MPHSTITASVTFNNVSQCHTQQCYPMLLSTMSGSTMLYSTVSVDITLNNVIFYNVSQHHSTMSHSTMSALVYLHGRTQPTIHHTKGFSSPWFGLKASAYQVNSLYFLSLHSDLGFSILASLCPVIWGSQY